MIAVRMVEVAIHEVVNVVAVGDRGMAAIGTVLMAFFVLAAIMGWSTRGRVRRGDGQVVFLDRAAIGVVQVTIVQVIDVTIVDDGRVATAGPMLVLVSHMMTGHCQTPSFEMEAPEPSAAGSGNASAGASAITVFDPSISIVNQFRRASTFLV